MKFKALCVLLFLGGLWPAKASADNRFIVRSRLDLQTLQSVSNPPLLPPICTLVGGLGDPLGNLFLITSSLDLDDLLDLPGQSAGNCACRSGSVAQLISSWRTKRAPRATAC